MANTPPALSPFSHIKNIQMKIIIPLIGIAFTLFASSCGGTDKPMGDGHSHQHGASTGTYTCPMHPEVMTTAAGKCPKCGMALEKK